MVGGVDGRSHPMQQPLAKSTCTADPKPAGIAISTCLIVGFLVLGNIEAGMGSEAAPPKPDRASPSPAGVCPPFHLLDEDGEIINPVTEGNADRPYSPRKTCGACHDYEKITRGYHFTQGAGEQPTADQQARCAWALSPGNYGGTWCSPAPLYKYLSPKKNASARTMDLTSFSFITTGCAGCHPGGGPMEFDRDGKRYDRRMRDPAGGLEPGGDNRFDGDYYRARWSETGVLEADCLICHLPEYDVDARRKQLKSLNFRWAATAGAGLGRIVGSVAEGGPPQVRYDESLFDPDGKLSPHIVRQPRDEACLACHAKPGWKKRGANFRARTDVHVRAGLKCVDCHPAGSSAADPRIGGREVHDFGKGDDPGGHCRDDLDNTGRSCAGCHQTGDLGAPIAKHRWLAPIHLEKIACQTCHVPQRAVKAAQVVASDVFNPGTKIPTKGKHLWTFYGPDMEYWNHYGDLEMMGYDDKPTDPFRPTLARYRGKIYPVNRVHSAWPAIEVEGKPGLMQPKMQDVYKMWKDHQADPSTYAELAAIRDDTGDGVPEVNTAKEIDALIDSVTAMLRATDYPMDGKRVVWVMDDRVYSSGTEYRTLAKRPWEASPYGNVHKYNHDVYPAKAALGAGGCTDCHHPDADFFFARVVRYPFDSEGAAVTQPQYRLLGLNGTLVTLGAWREARLKPALYVALLILAAVLAAAVARIAIGRRADGPRPALPWRLVPAVVAAGGAAAALWIVRQPDLCDYALPSRFWLDGNHGGLALAIFASGAVALALGRPRHRPMRAAAALIAAALLTGALSGLLMLLKLPGLDDVSRIAFTVFDGSLFVVVCGLILAGLAGLRFEPPDGVAE